MEKETADSYQQRQFRRLGMQEAYTDEVRKALAGGVTFLERPYKTVYDGDRVDATVRLKRDHEKERYNIVRLDMQLQKAGEQNKIGQTFFISPVKKVQDESGDTVYHQSKVTLKEGYNLLSGRPVHKQIIDPANKLRDAWLQLDLTTKIGGNYRMEAHINEGFNLDNVLNQYAITEKFRSSLVKSLNRGNLQLATFVPEAGKEEKLYVSPDIKNAGLFIYNTDKKLVPVEEQLRQGLVSPELGERLLQAAQLKPEQKQAVAKDHKKKPKIR